MPLPPNTLNYQIGGAKVIWGGLDFGNVVSLELDPTDIEVREHFTSRSGARKVDKSVVVQKRLLWRVGFDEHAAELYRTYVMGGNAGLTVDPLTQPLVEKNLVIEYRNEAGVIWTYSHTKANVRPSGSMDFGEFDEYVGGEFQIESLEDATAFILGSPVPHGRFTFTA